MAAEELYARTFSGAAQRGNANYDVVKCEFALPDPPCEEVPLSMGLHLDHLFNDFINADKTETVFHRGYGAGWSFVRWAADTSPEEEPDFFSSLVSNAGQYPGENLARLLRRPLPDLVVDWLVAFATDDYPGFSPAREVHSLESWDLRHIYNTLYQAGLAPFNVQQYPLSIRENPGFGAFRIDVPQLPSAAGSFVKLSGAQSSTQLVWLTSPNNRPLRDDTGLRLTVVRLR
jgi:hypothetical protein